MPAAAFLSPLERTVLRHEKDLNDMPIELMKQIVIFADAETTGVSVIIACKASRKHTHHITCRHTCRLTLP